jgi:translation initiation factor 2 subunit 1
MLEYNDQEALILAASITRKRIKNVKHLLKLGHQDCM